MKDRLLQLRYRAKSLADNVSYAARNAVSNAQNRTKLPEWAKKKVYVEKKVPVRPLLPAASSVIERRAIVTSGDMMCYAILAPDNDVLRIELWIKGHKIGALSPLEAHQLVALLDKAVGLPY